MWSLSSGTPSGRISLPRVSTNSSLTRLLNGHAAISWRKQTCRDRNLLGRQRRCRYCAEACHMAGRMYGHLWRNLWRNLVTCGAPVTSGRECENARAERYFFSFQLVLPFQEKPVLPANTVQKSTAVQAAIDFLSSHRFFFIFDKFSGILSKFLYVPFLDRNSGVNRTHRESGMLMLPTRYTTAGMRIV